MIAPELVEQMQRVWRTLAEAIAQCDDAEWTRGGKDMATPARAAIHTIETAEFYTREQIDGFTWGHRFSLDCEQAEATDLPSRQQVLAYLDEVATTTSNSLSALSDADLSRATAFPWTGGTRLATVIYLMRHTQHHTAQISAELRRRGLAPAAWH